VVAVGTGRTDEVADLRAPDGRVLANTSETLSMNLTRETYRKVMQTGVVLTKIVELNADAYQIRLLIYDRVTGNMGSVYIPVKKS